MGMMAVESSTFLPTVVFLFSAPSWRCRNLSHDYHYQNSCEQNGGQMLEEEVCWREKCRQLEGDVKGIIKVYVFPWR